MASAKPLRPGDLSTLDARLRAFYAKDSPDYGDRVALSRDEFTGLAVVQHLLSFVLAQPKSANASVRWRNTYVLAWARSLSRYADHTDQTFLRRQIYFRLAKLLRRHGQATESRDHVVDMFDALNVWSSRELPFLARAAGRVGVGAPYFAERASPLVLSESVDEEDLIRMVAAIREFKEPSDGQYLLLLQSGYANREDYLRLLFNLADRYADPDGPPANLNVAGSALRTLLEFLMDAYADGEPLIVDAAAVARRRSDVVSGMASNVIKRRSFFHGLVSNTLLERDRRRVRVNESVAPTATEPGSTTPDMGTLINVNFRPDIPRRRHGDQMLRSNTVRGDGPGTNVIPFNSNCGDDLTKAP